MREWLLLTIRVAAVCKTVTLEPSGVQFPSLSPDDAMPTSIGTNTRSGIHFEAKVDYLRPQLVGMNSELVIHERVG